MIVPRLRANRNSSRGSARCWFGGLAARPHLCEVLLHGAIDLLRARQTAGLQRLSQLLKQLAEGIGLVITASAVMMVMVALGLRSLALQVLLDGGEVLLRGRHISRLQILPELVEGLG